MDAYGQLAGNKKNLLSGNQANPEYTLRVPAKRGCPSVGVAGVLCFASALSLFAQEPARDAGALLQQGQALAQAGRLAEAEVSLTSAAALAPTDAATLTLLAEVKSRLGESEDAVLLFRRVLVQEPRSPAAHLNLAIALADAKDLPTALTEVATAIRLEPDDARAHLNRARMLVDSGQIPQARTEFARAATLAPGDADVYLFWAECEKNDKQFTTAADLFTKALKLKPGSARSYLLLAQSLDAAARTKEAIAAWKQAVAIEPGDEEALYALSQALRESAPAEAAEWRARFEQTRVAKQQTERATELGNQAYAAMQKQSWSSAIDNLQQGITICGHCPIEASLHQHLGLAECHRGDLGAGEKELRLALELKPEDRETVEALRWIAAQRTHPAPTQ